MAPSPPRRGRCKAVIITDEPLALTGCGRKCIPKVSSGGVADCMHTMVAERRRRALCLLLGHFGAKGGAAAAGGAVQSKSQKKRQQKAAFGAQRMRARALAN